LSALKLVWKLATRRGTLAGLALVVGAAVVVPVALRAASRSSLTLPAPTEARDRFTALRDRTRAAAASTAGRVKSRLPVAV
jgi:hypothetical protein